MARPVVSTTVGAEGLGIEPGLTTPASTSRASSPARWCSLRDPARRAQLGGAGRHLVETCYSWPTIGRVFEQRCEEVVAAHVYDAEAPTVVLICHEAERLDRDGVASWLASTMRLAGLLIIRDGAGGAGRPRAGN